MKKSKTIFQFIRSLNKRNKEILLEYISYDYVSKRRTGKGKFRNFLVQYNTPEGIEIVKEIIKFKKLTKKQNSKK